MIAKNTVISLFGVLIPLVVGIFAIPYTIRLLGNEVFGLLVVVWAIISYMSLLDLGLGKALIKYVAESIGKEDLKDVKNYFWISLGTSFIISLLVAVLIFLLREVIAGDILKVENSLFDEAVRAIAYISFGIPFIFILSICNAFLKALQKFTFITTLQLINSAVNYIVPIAIYLLTQSFSLVVLSLVLFKVLIVIIYSVEVAKLLSAFPKQKLEFSSSLKSLVNFGWWVSISNVIGPVIDYLDRFIIAYLITLSAVAYYSTPLEVVLKISVVAAAISSVIYSAISNSVNYDKVKTGVVINSGYKVLLLCIIPITFTLTIFAKEGLELWVGSDYAENGFLVVQIVGIGILFKSMTHIPISYLHSIGKPSLVAKLHIAELVVYVILLYIMTKSFGLIGTALAHAIRLFMDYSVMTYSARNNSLDFGIKYTKFFLILIGSVLMLIIILLVSDLYIRITIWAALSLVYLFILGREIQNIWPSLRPRVE